MITTIVIATKLRLYQELLAALLGSRPGLAVIGVSASEEEATHAVRVKEPDVLIIDAALPGVWNVTAAAEAGAVQVVVFGLADSPRPVTTAREAGCDAVLTATTTSRRMIETVERLSLAGELAEPAQELGAIATLTERELEVLRMIARGLSNKEIAAELTVSLATVKTHVHNVLYKLGARRRVDAGRLLHFATTNGSFEVAPPGEPLGRAG